MIRIANPTRFVQTTETKAVDHVHLQMITKLFGEPTHVDDFIGHYQVHVRAPANHNTDLRHLFRLLPPGCVVTVAKGSRALEDHQFTIRLPKTPALHWATWQFVVCVLCAVGVGLLVYL